MPSASYALGTILRALSPSLCYIPATTYLYSHKNPLHQPGAWTFPLPPQRLRPPVHCTISSTSVFGRWAWPGPAITGPCRQPEWRLPQFPFVRGEHRNLQSHGGIAIIRVLTYLCTLTLYPHDQQQPLPPLGHAPVALQSSTINASPARPGGCISSLSIASCLHPIPHGPSS